MVNQSAKQKMVSTWLGLLALTFVVGIAFFLIKQSPPEASMTYMMPSGMTNSPSPSPSPVVMPSMTMNTGSCENPQPGFVGALCINVTYSGLVPSPAPEVPLSMSSGSLLVPNCNANSSMMAGLGAMTKKHKYIFQNLLLPDASYKSSTPMYFCLSISTVTPPKDPNVKTIQATKCEPYLGAYKASITELSLSRDEPFESATIDMKCS